MRRPAFTAGILVFFVALCASGEPAPPEAVPGQRWPVQLPAESVSPATAQVISAGVLTAGGLAGATLLTIATANGTSRLPGAIVSGAALVFAPSLGRWIAGESSTARQLTLFRLVLGASAGTAAAVLIAPNRSSASAGAGYAINGLFGTLVLVNAVYDVATTRRDILLERAARVHAQRDPEHGARGGAPDREEPP